MCFGCLRPVAGTVSVQAWSTHHGTARRPMSPWRRSARRLVSGAMLHHAAAYTRNLAPSNKPLALLTVAESKATSHHGKAFCQLRSLVQALLRRHLESGARGDQETGCCEGPKCVPTTPSGLVRAFPSVLFPLHNGYGGFCGKTAPNVEALSLERNCLSICARCYRCLSVMGTA